MRLDGVAGIIARVRGHCAAFDTRDRHRCTRNNRARRIGDSPNDAAKGRLALQHRGSSRKQQPGKKQLPNFRFHTLTPSLEISENHIYHSLWVQRGKTGLIGLAQRVYAMRPVLEHLIAGIQYGLGDLKADNLSNVCSSITRMLHLGQPPFICDGASPNC
jgi:hypothetical protein